MYDKISNRTYKYMNLRRKRMKETLEKLWDDYLVESDCKMENQEEIENIRRIMEIEKEITETFNKESKKLFDEYARLADEEGVRFAKNAFIKGVSFSVSFLIEAIKG